MGTKNRKAQIGATLTWIAAFLIIVFLATIFVVVSLMMAGEKKVSFAGNNIEFSSYKGEKMELNEQLMSFLNSEMIYDGKKMKVREFLDLSYDDNSRDVFLKVSGDYFDKIYVISKDGTTRYSVFVYGNDPEHTPGGFYCNDKGYASELELNKWRIKLCVLKEYYDA